MARSSKSKRKKAKVKTVPVLPKKQEVENPEIENDEQPSHFGGLPNRDLKKNLGCG